MAHVLMITPSYSPRLGGVERHVWQIGQALRTKGWSVTVVTRQFPGLAESEVKDGVAIHRFSFPKVRFLGLWSIWRTMVLRYSQLVSQADVVHIHDVFIWYLPLRLLFWRKKVITTFHGWEGIFPVPVKNILIRQLGVWLSTKTVAVGRYLEKYYYFKADAVMYGGIEVPKHLPKKEKLLVYVGRLDSDTGLPVLLKALKAGAWSGKVIFCGDGPLRGQVKLVGQVKGFVDPRPYLKKALVVFAGGYLSILEAFASRCAVVAAAENPLKKDYFLLSPFARWIRLVSSPAEVSQALAKPASRSAFEWVKKQTWQAVTNQYLKLYGQMLHK